MSTAPATRIVEGFEDRIQAVRTAEDGAEILREVSAALARRLAETVFFKVQTEPGWTVESGNALAGRMLDEQALGIAETIHAFGGTLDLAQDLVRAAADAYGARLRELAQAYGQGGRA